jgi:flavodoxin
LPVKILIVVDSVYGNTLKIAEAIKEALKPAGEVSLVRPAEANLQDLPSLGLLLVGSPVQGGRALKPVQDFLNRIPSGGLKRVNVATFDTRMKGAFPKLFGFAGARIADALKSKGGNLVAPAEGYFVKGREGPLLEGEIERAGAWAKGLAQNKA